jgi:hypothetical protein
MTSPICQVKDGGGAYQSTSDGVNVTPGNTVTINLVSSAGVGAWQISCVYTDETSDAATVTASLTINSVAKTATFTAPVAGKAYIFESKVNGGIGPDGVARNSFTTTFGVFTLTAEGNRVFALNQTFEGSATYGWTGDLNDVVRNGGSGSSRGTLVRAMADTDQTITVGQLANNQRVELTGTNTAERKVTLPLPTGNTDTYSLSVTNSATKYVVLQTAALSRCVRLAPGTDMPIQVTASGVDSLAQNVYDPRKFGARLDGVTDDIAAFEAMHLAMPTTGAVVKLDGVAWLSRKWRISKRVLLSGFGGEQSLNFECGFFFPPGETGIQLDGSANSLDGNSSASSTVECVDFKSRIMIHQSATGSDQGRGVLVWSAATTVRVGDCYTKAGGADPTWMFRAISVTANGGRGPATSTASEPAWVLTHGATLVDGNGITWRSERLPFVHATTTAYIVGQRVFAPSDNRYYFECEVAGTSAGTRPAQLLGGNDAAGVTIDDTFTDGTVTWRIKAACAIRVHSNLVKIRNIKCVNLSGPAGINAGGTGVVAAGYTDANHNKWIDVFAEFAGCGIHLAGSDCNGWRISNLWTSGMGALHPTPNAAAGLTGLGGHGVHDVSQGGGVIDNSYFQVSSGRPILQNGLSILTCISCYQEVTDPSRFRGHNVTTIGGSLHRTDVGGGVEAGATGWVNFDGGTFGGRGVYETDISGPVDIAARLLAQDGYSALQLLAPEASDPNDYALRYEYAGQPAGCWAMQHGQQAQNAAYLLYTVAAGLGLGAGWFGIPIGHLLGDTNVDTPIFDGRNSGLTDRRLRGGARKQGDRFRSQTDDQILLGDGYRGRVWTANQQMLADGATQGIAASTIEPTTNTGKPGEQVWKCTIAGNTHATTEPTWPAAPTPGVTTQTDGTVTWTFLGYRPARVIEQRDDKARGPHYRADQTTTTTNANQLIDGGAVVNGEDLALPEGAITRVTHTVLLKKASTAEGGEIEVKSTWIRNGTGAPTQIGATAITYNLAGTTLDGTTVTHVANGNRIELWGDPESADTLKWNWFRTQIEGVD